MKGQANVRHFSLSVALSVVALAGVRAEAQPAGAAVMTPGLWQITVQTQSPIVGPPITHTVCIDKAHVTRPEPPKSKPADDCQVSLDPAAANETAYTIHCAKRNVSSSSRFTYSGDHFDGTVKITTADAEVHQVYTALRIGDGDDPLPSPAATPPAP
jgi:hypothetical protein